MMNLRYRPASHVNPVLRPILLAAAACLAAAAGSAATYAATNGSANAAAGAAAARPEAAEARAAEPEANVLQAQSKVAEMAEETLDTLKSKIAMVGVVGWAVFSGDPVTASLDPGLGEARSVEGEAWYMRMSHPVCVPRGYREVLVFRDEDAFREFREGDLNGQALEKLHTGTSGKPLVAFKFQRATDDGDVDLQPADLSKCRFELEQQLDRGLIAPPSSTKPMGGATHPGGEPGNSSPG